MATKWSGTPSLRITAIRTGQSSAMSNGVFRKRWRTASATSAGLSPSTASTTSSATSPPSATTCAGVPSGWTRIRVQPDGTPAQVVADGGEVALEVVDAVEGESPAEVAEAVRQRFRNTPFDIAEDWPVRMAVILKDGVPDHFVAIYSHMAIDG